MVQVQDYAVSSLRPWDANPRINDHAVDAVAASIREFGFNVPIICDQHLTIVAGHTRWKAALKLQMEKVPVIVLEMSDSQRKAFSIADNKTAEIADWDFPKLREILLQLKQEEVTLETLGFSRQELRDYMHAIDKDDDAVSDAPATSISKSGDLWQLGDHRLLCGDSTRLVSIKAISEHYVADHVFGGPPYFNQRDYAHWSSLGCYLSDMDKIIRNCCSVLKTGGVLVWNIANDCASHHDLASEHSCLMKENGLQYLDTIAWVKSGGNFAIPRNMHIRRNRCYYPAFQWEPLLVFQKPGEMPKMTPEAVAYMVSHQTNVWNIPAVTHQMELYGHPAVCPVEIPYRCILAYTPEKGVVFEPFGGSGTTLIAAEKAGRTAILVEQSPAYCDMIIRRWEKYTDRNAVRIASGIETNSVAA